MKVRFSLQALFLLSISSVFAQDGKIISKQPFVLGPKILKIIDNIDKTVDSTFAERINGLNFYRLTYLSDGLKVTAYAAEPKKPGKYPCIITNRGGNREFGKWDTTHVAIHFGVMASWGYVVIGSQYRGNDGGEGQEEYGGKDINDVLNLVPVFAQFPNADTSRIGLEGISRGGMMTYLAMKKSCKFKAAVVMSGAANEFISLQHRPGLDDSVHAQLIPNYYANKEKELKARSASYWADQMCKTTPLLIMQGSSDWRVPTAEALDLVSQLYKHKHPTRFVLYEGADHGISEFMFQTYDERKRHFDYYLRDGKKWPSMEPHGN
jgi:dipeptidyl aminopeptidase/acylaminoacyl peptidase